METKEVKVDKNLIGYCGLYCGACRSFLKGKCAGCHENVKATWCQVRRCNMEHNYASCADCQITTPSECKKFNNFISKLMGILFNSDRATCIQAIKEKGYEGYAIDMAAAKRMTLKRK